MNTGPRQAADLSEEIIWMANGYLNASQQVVSNYTLYTFFMALVLMKVVDWANFVQLPFLRSLLYYSYLNLPL